MCSLLNLSRIVELIFPKNRIIAVVTKSIYRIRPFLEVLALRIQPRCSNTHNCLSLTLERWWNTEVSFNIQSLALPCNNIVMYRSLLFCLIDPEPGSVGVQYTYFSLLTYTNFCWWHFALLLQQLKLVSDSWSERYVKMDGRTDRYDGWNSYLDSYLVMKT